MKTIDGPHCQQCGTQLSWDETDEGYTPCCNERLVVDCDDRDCSHE